MLCRTCQFLPRGCIVKNRSSLLGGILGMVGVMVLSFGATAFAQHTVTISGAHLGSAYGNSDDGGFTPSSPFHDNTLRIVTGAVIDEDAYGACHDTADITGNIVLISGGTIGDGTSGNGNVYGGKGDGGNVANNSVTVSGGTVRWDVFGGWSESGDAAGNRVAISDGEVKWNVLGGRSEKGSANDNVVTVGGGEVGEWVVGGWSEDGRAVRNVVTMSAGTVNRGLRGGETTLGNAEGNIVTMTGGTVTNEIYGGISEKGDVTGNRVAVSGGTAESIYGGWAEESHAVENTVVVTGNADVLGRVFGGGSLDGNAAGNSVTIGGGTVGQDVFGGFSDGGNAAGNRVEISGGTIGDGTIDYGNVFGGSSGSGHATGNSVTVTGGTVKSNVYGGEAYLGDAAGNSVTISGGTIEKDVFGGCNSDTFGGDGNATHNTVTLSGTPDLRLSNIYGGYSQGTGDVFTGNTLNVHTGNHTVKSVQNFENMNFYVPATTGDGGTMITATESANIDNSIINVGVAGKASPLQLGDRIVLIDVTGAGGLDGTAANAAAGGRGMHGVTLKYDFDILRNPTNPNQLWARLANVTVNPQDTVFSDGYLGGSMLIRQGGERVAFYGVGGAVNAAWNKRNCGWAGFADVSGNWMRYNTGAGVDLNSFTAVAGVSRCWEASSGRMTAGLFFEYGSGSYDAFRSFVNAASVRSNGRLDQIGGGVLGRFEFGDGGYRYGYNSSLSRYYLDGSFRTGNVCNKFTSDLRDLRDDFGVAACFTSNATYYGTHFGGGKIRQFHNASLDLYGKYLWSQVKGNSVTLTTGEPIDFKSINSHRMRFGGRYAFAAGSTSSRICPYVGAAWDQELDGIARASTNGYAIDAPSLRGGTGIGEAGVTFKPASSRGLFADFGVQGYTGRREGVTAALTVGRRF